MIKRLITPELKRLLKEYPVVTLLGPRQSGKTTLAKEFLKNFAYTNLEQPENRQHALEDPKSFLAQFAGPVVIDEIQRVPQLLSYIQVKVDASKKTGQFVLTGSHQLQLHAAITQSLAGRTAILQLFPFSIEELAAAKIELPSFEHYIFRGFLPRIYDQNQRPTTAYSNYFQTYVERDVRQLINIKDVTLFEKFLKLLAGRVGQIVDYSSLGNDVGVDSKTIKNWLSILEASFIIFKLAPYFENFGKRVIKSPKFYFTDVGLLAYLLGIENPKQVLRDPLVGNLFENLVVLEAVKANLNRGKTPNLYFYRDSGGFEIDLVKDRGRELTAVEIKSAATYSTNLSKNLLKAANLTSKFKNFYLIYSGSPKNIGIVKLQNFMDTSRILA